MRASHACYSAYEASSVPDCAQRGMSKFHLFSKELARHLQHLGQTDVKKDLGMSSRIWIAALGLGALSLSACTHTANDALPKKPDARTQSLAQIKTDLDKSVPVAKTMPIPKRPVVVAPAQEAKSDALPAIEAMGFAQVSKQPGSSLNQRRIMALRAARLDALRNLTEQIHGIRIDAHTTIRDARVANDTIDAVIQGELRGAQTVSIKPKGSDTFEVVLKIDPATVAYILKAAQGKA